MSLPQGFLDELKARVSLPDLVARKVKLVRSGRDLKGCCPFHKEKTPSFHVFPDHYHCFGCGAHGDAIRFLVEAEGQDFMGAVRQLADAAGMAIPEAERDEHRQERAGLFGLLEAAAPPLCAGRAGARVPPGLGAGFGYPVRAEEGGAVRHPPATGRGRPCG